MSTSALNARTHHCRSSLITMCLWLGLVSFVLAGVANVDFLAAIAKRESDLSPAAVNPSGYVGLFQMGTMAMTDAGYYKSNGTAANSWLGTWTGKDGITSLATFKSNPDLQIQAVSAYYDKLTGYIKYFGLESYIGREVGGVPVTLSGLVAGAHLVGIGALTKFLESDGSIVPKDGNGVPVTDYMVKFGGYAVGGPAPTFAALKAAAPSGGVVAAPGGSTGGSGGGAGGGSTASIPPRFGVPPIVGADTGAAFYDHSGYSMAQVGEFLRTLVAATIFLWTAWTLMSTWRIFNRGRGTPMQFVRENTRAIGVLSLTLLFIL